MSGTPSVSSYRILGDSEKARFRNTNKSGPTGLRQRSRTQFISLPTVALSVISGAQARRWSVPY
jgi:hypothetical protein